MSLAKYREKRDFSATSEPAGSALHANGRSYVIQKHAASHLHYDFRLELGGVLLSWAVPKGPSLDPAVKRLAMQTEDHPVEYGGFEGTIPEGEYGGGTVMVWDRGTWEPEGDADQAYKKGHLNFRLQGEKLSGGWHLVRTHRGGDKQRGWLLFKATDDAARPGDTSLLEDQSKSVLSGRDLSDIAKGAAVKKVAVGRSKTNQTEKSLAEPDDSAKANRTAKASKLARTPAPLRSSKAKVSQAKASKIQKPASRPEPPGAIRAELPNEIVPELATLVSETPTDDGFVHEVKFDGYRVLCRVAPGELRLFTRNGEDWTDRMPTLAAALGKLRVESAVLDGELVALDENGLTDFQLLQNSFSGKGEAPIAYYAFDLLYLNGFDWRPVPLLERKAELKALFAGLPAPAAVTLRYSDHVLGNGAQFFAEAAKLGLEGVVSKRANSSYRPGRGKDWVKSKSLGRQEFVIVGYSEPGGSRSHLGALLLGARKAGALTYCGKVGTGFTDKALSELHDKLSPLEIGRSELDNPPRGADARGVHWVTPKLVAEVAYTGFTQEGLLRHPTFKGLREDKPASEVVLEEPRALALRRAAKSASVTTSQVAAPPLTHPDKILYPELGISKRELYAYYEAVAELMLPQVVNRPLTLLRCPEGSGKQCFFQKHPGPSLADGLRRVMVRGSEGQAEYAAIEDRRGLLSLVQMGVLEAHISGAIADDSERPNQIVFDLDPDTELGFADVIEAAHAVRDLLLEFKLKSWLKTTGGKGLHVTVPIEPRADWDEVKAFCRTVAEELARREPGRFLAVMSKAKRKGKIFVDYLRNGRGQTFIAPYSPRARPGAGIAMPIEWGDLSAKFKPEVFNVRSAEKYLAKRKRDPFTSLLTHLQPLPSAAGVTRPRARRA